MVVGIVANLFKVVMFSADSQALLRVGRTRELGLGVAEEDVLELVHSGICKHKRRVVLYDHRCRRHNRVSLRCKKVEKLLSNLF